MEFTIGKFAPLYKGHLYLIKKGDFYEKDFEKNLY